MRMFTEKLVLGVDEGKFEDCVNDMSSQDSDDIHQSTILRNVTKVVHLHRATANAVLAGSRKKRTQVDGKSDFDIWIRCNEVIDASTRMEISESIKIEMQKDYPDLEFVYKTNATSFSFSNRTVEFDVVFDKNSFSPHVSGPPNRDPFYNKPGRQRAVKAFKLLQWNVPVQFSKNVAGHAIEAFVVSVDEAKGSIDDSSGAHLFAQCLLELCYTPADQKSVRAFSTWTAAAKAVCTGNGIDSRAGLRRILGDMGIEYVGK
jgi:hypothetical protein